MLRRSWNEATADFSGMTAFGIVTSAAGFLLILLDVRSTHTASQGETDEETQSRQLVTGLLSATGGMIIILLSVWLVFA